MKVWVVSETQFYETSVVIGVFKKRDDAVAFIVPLAEKVGAIFKNKYGDTWETSTMSYDLEEFELE